MRLLRTVYQFFFFIALTIVTACEKFEGDQTIPSYLAIDTIYLENNNLIEEGSLTHNFTDVWVYVDDQLIGAYELPAVIPVLASGGHKLAIYAGIKQNAMSGTRVQYPFMKPQVINPYIFLVDSVIPIIPVVVYHDTTQFSWIEDFEGSSHSLIKTSNSDTAMSFIPNDHATVPLMGFKSGVGYVTIDAPILEITTFDENKPGFDLPDGGQPVFLEMDYKTNTTLRVGVFIRSGNTIIQNTVLILYSSSNQWKKVYVNFTPVLNNYYNADFYNVFFRVDKESATEEEYIILDNLKLVTR